MMLLRLVWRSLANRRVTALLTVLAVAASVALLLGVEKVRTGARESFADTISGTDLIVGARAGDVQLLLYAVFRIGNATANMTWESYQDIAARPEVAWIVPISLGRQPQGLSRARHRQRLLRALPLPARAGPRVRRGRAVRRTCSTRCWAPTWPSGWATGSATRSWSATASATCPSPITPTSRSGSRASSPGPARRSTARSTSRSRRWRRSTSTGGAARGCRGRASRPRRCAAWS